MTKYESSFFSEGPKKKILQEALKHLATQGLFQFTLSEIARQAGISRQKMGYHFKGTEQILEELIPIWGQSGQAVTLETLSASLGAEPLELISKIVEASFLWKERCPHFAKMTPVINQLAGSKKIISTIQKQVTDTGLARIASLLEKGGVKKNKIEKLARGVHLLLIGGVLYSLSTPGISSRAVEEVTQESIELLIKSSKN